MLSHFNGEFFEKILDKQQLQANVNTKTTTYNNGNFSNRILLTRPRFGYLQLESREHSRQIITSNVWISSKIIFSDVVRVENYIFSKTLIEPNAFVVRPHALLQPSYRITQQPDKKRDFSNVQQS